VFECYGELEYCNQMNMLFRCECVRVCACVRGARGWVCECVSLLARECEGVCARARGCVRECVCLRECVCM
jgi:hypothetical protein